MFNLPVPEICIFSFALLVHFAAAMVGVVQLRPSGERYRRLVLPLIAFAVTLEAVVLMFRAIAIKAVPLTGLFESLIVLAISFGLIYLFFSIAIRQVWFGSVISWIIFLIVLIAAFLATPASQAHSLAATPWAIVHGISMILGGAAITFSTANSILYLFCKRKLKQKKVLAVLGRVPNLEKLGAMNLLGLKSCFVFLTLGLVSGIVMAIIGSSELEITFTGWLTDSKVVLVIISWVLLGVILILQKTARLKSKMTAYITMITFFLFLFAFTGTAIFCSTKHDFSRGGNTIKVEK